MLWVRGLFCILKEVAIGMKNKQAEKTFTEGNLAKQILLFALPFMASNALLVLYSTIDMVIVGKYVGTAGLSAVSQSSQIINFATMVTLGFSNAGQVLISQALGAGKRKEMNHVIGTLFSFVTLIGLVLSVVILIGGNFFLDAVRDLLLQFRVIRQHLFGLIPALTELLAIKTEPGTALLDDAHIRGHIQH